MIMYGAPPPRNANILDDEEVQKRLEMAEKRLLRHPGVHTKMTVTRHEFVLTAVELRALAGAPEDAFVRYDNGVLCVWWVSEKKK